MTEPLCKIAKETGTVPLDCLFECQRGGCHDRVQPAAPAVGATCKHCGTSGLRWRQQTGRWRLFTDKPGVEHKCSGGRPSAKEDFA